MKFSNRRIDRQQLSRAPSVTSDPCSIQSAKMFDGSLELPHTPGCLVCGRENPHGLRLSLFVEPASSIVRVEFAPREHHIGFEGIVHGGAIATVVDEAMVWAATWAGKRFCVCGEMTVRFRQNARVGQLLRCEARVENIRARLVQTSCQVSDAAGQVYATGSGKYVPVSAEHHRSVVETFARSESTAAAAAALGKG